MSPDRALLIIFCFLIILAGVAMIVAHEVKKGPPKKLNVRVPRQTLWERTNRYHEDRS